MRIAVIVPHSYSGGTMRGALNAAVQIHDGAAAHGDDVQVEFGYVDIGQAAIHAGFRDLQRRHIPYRPITVELKEGVDFRNPAPGRSGIAEKWAIFNDGLSNFDDADFVLIISDRIEGERIAPTYRYGMVVYDFIQRYVPEIFGDVQDEASPEVWRKSTERLRHLGQAEAVFVTTEQTRRDAISYGGVPASRVITLPMEFDPLDAERELAPEAPAGGDLHAAAESYILWTTNATPHKNQFMALEALSLLYRTDPAFPRVQVTGQYTHLLDPNEKADPQIAIPWIEKVRNVIERSETLRSKLTFRGNLSDDDYTRLLAGAKLLFHPAIFDNGTFSIIEAAWMGVPSASSRYAAIEEISSRFGIPLTLFDWRDPADMARGLRQANATAEEMRRALPPRDALRRYSRDAQAPEYWARMRDIAVGRGDR